MSGFSQRFRVRLCLRWSAACAVLVLGFAAVAAPFLVESPASPLAPNRSLFLQTKIPLRVAATLRTSCADCHSNQSVWPWYAHVPGVSWFLLRDVRMARRHLDFSDWQSISDRGPEELAAAYSGICENLLTNAMPKRAYILMHPEARVSPAQRAEVCAWTNDRQMQLLRQAAAAERTSP